MSNKKCEWEWKEFDDCLEKINVPIKLAKTDYQAEGTFPIVSQEDELISGYWNNANDVVHIERPVVIFGDHTRCVKFIDFDFVVGADGVKIINPIKSIKAKFLAYYLRNIDIPNLGYARHFRLLRERKIPVPPLAEQERIVKVLDDAFAKIDKIKTDAETNLQNAKDLFQTTLANELTITDDKIKEGWEEFIFEELFSLKSGDNLPTNKLKGGDYPVYGGNGIAGYHTEYNLDGDNVLVGRVGALCGNVRNIKGKIWVTDNCFKVTYKILNKSHNQYITYALGFLNLGSYAKQAAQPVISNIALRDIKIHLPPLSIQKQIVAKLDSLSEKVKQLESNYKQVIADCDELKKSILKKAFNGEL